MDTQTKRATVVAAIALSAGSAAAEPTWSNTLGDPGFTGSYVASFAVHDDGTGPSLYATGQFAAAGVPGTSNVARWTGTGWASVGGGLQDQYSNVLATFQGDLIAGGYFNTAGSQAGTAKLARWDGSAWKSMDAQLESFLSSIWDLVVWDDGSGAGEALYVAGNYLDIGGDVELDHISKWDGASFTAVGGTIGGAVPLIVLDLHVTDLGDGEKLYAGGRFLNIGGVAANNVAVWDGTDWSPLGTGLVHTSIAQVITMTTFDDGSGPALYVGGTFTTAGGVPATRVAKWDGASWSALGDGFDSTVQELIVFDDGTGAALYALGNFDASGADPVLHVAKWTGTDWEQVGSGTNGNVFGAIVYDAGEGPALHIGGGFNIANGLASAGAASILAAPACPADLNGDTELDFFDVSAFLTLFNDGDLAADFNGDNMLDFFDVSAFLQAFNAGC